MFCYKCGNQISEGVRFCHKCGSQILAVEPKKKSKKRLFGIAGIIIVIAIVAMLSGEDIDYVEMVKTVRPYESSGISATYLQVFNKYLVSPEWEERIVSKEFVYVDVKGTHRINDNYLVDILITFKLTPYGDKKMCWIEPVAAKIDGDNEDAEELIELMFGAYDKGFENFQDYANYKFIQFMFN